MDATLPMAPEPPHADFPPMEYHHSAALPGTA
jgi:hypothetical protein